MLKVSFMVVPALLLGLSFVSADEPKIGVIVETVTKGFDAEKAGLQPGDTILRWDGSGATGVIASPFDLSGIEVEQALRGQVVLQGLRGGQTQVWTLMGSRWGIKARPQMSESFVQIHRQARELAKTGKLAESAKAWTEAAGQATGFTRTWFLLQVATLWSDARSWEAADKAYQTTLDSETEGPAITAQLLQLWGDSYRSRSDWKNGEACYQRAIIESRKLAAESLTITKSLTDLGRIARLRGDLAKAKEYHLQALDLILKLAPGSLAEAAALNNLGNVADNRGDLAEAEKYHHRALELRQKLAPESDELATSLNNLGSLARKRGDLLKAEADFRQALDIYQKLSPDSLNVAGALNNIGLVANDLGDVDMAETYYNRALQIQEKLDPGSVTVALMLSNLGRVAYARGDLDKADDYHQRALELRQKLSPNSLDVADSLTGLGLVAWDRGNLDRAEELQGRALEIIQRLAPDSVNLAASLTNLGNVSWDRGDLDKAEAYARQALDLYQTLAPDNIKRSTTLDLLGGVLQSRGDLAKAEEYYRLALELTQRLSPDSLDMATSYDFLGNLFVDRGDLIKAEQYFRLALAIEEKKAPGSRNVASIVKNLGSVYQMRGNLATAEEYYRQAQVIEQKVAPDSLDVAESLSNLGVLLKNRGDLRTAEEYDRQALDIQLKLAPESTGTAATCTNLAILAENRKDLATAEKYYRLATGILSKLAPESRDHAESLAGLARVLRLQGQADAAEVLYQQALHALEGQTAHYGGSEGMRSQFRADQSSPFFNFIDLLMTTSKPARAFEVAESWRARSMLELLSEVGVDIHEGVDPSLRAREIDLEHSLKAKSDYRIKLLTSGRPEKEVAKAEGEIADLHTQYADLQGRIRTNSPVYAALTQPQPLGAVETQQLLGDDTLLLEYILGDERSYVWAITRDSLHGYQLPARGLIEDLVRQLHGFLSVRERASRADGITGLGDKTHQRTVAAALSQMVLGPVAAEIKNKRLLIVKDGALQYVPFGVLPIPGDAERVLIQDHEIVTAPSASVVAELRRQAMGRPPSPKAVAVLADPVFDRDDPRVAVAQTPLRQPTAALSQTSPPNDRLTRSVADLGLGHLPRLPFSRREADAIMAVTPSGQGKKALGFEASRATATSPELAQYRIVHLATHALSDNLHPELSGLVLSLVDQRGRSQDGFLDLQDIYNLHLPVELVVLSACETGLGKEVKGEGLIGLTRGFMYAGATRVVASLWNADDVATKVLMERFYWAMEKQGARPAAALRQAQVSMLKEHRWNDPYYWAAFELQGEWK